MLDVLAHRSLIKAAAAYTYSNSRYKLLRDKVTVEDLEQLMYVRLYTNGLYKVYDPQYSLKGFIYRIANHCAMNASALRNTQCEAATLQQPLGADTSATLLDTVDATCWEDDADTYSEEEYLQQLPSTAESITEYIAERLSTYEPQNFLLEVAEGEYVPYSQRALFLLFATQRYEKAEIKHKMVNAKTKKAVAHVTFNPLWQELLEDVEDILGEL